MSAGDPVPYSWPLWPAPVYLQPQSCCSCLGLAQRVAALEARVDLEEPRQPTVPGPGEIVLHLRGGGRRCVAVEAIDQLLPKPGTVVQLVDGGAVEVDESPEQVRAMVARVARREEVV